MCRRVFYLVLSRRSVWLQPVFFRTSDEGHVDHKAHEARVNGIAPGDDQTRAFGEKTVMEQAARRLRESNAVSTVRATMRRVRSLVSAMTGDLGGVADRGRTPCCRPPGLREPSRS